MSKNETTIEENNGQVFGEVGQVVIQQCPDFEKLIPLVKGIAKAEIEKYTNDAKITAFERDEAFSNMVIGKFTSLEHSVEELQKAFSNPSMQFDFYEADKAYIKSGDENKLDILSSIISERIRASDETIKQITLSESIKVVPLLNKKLFDILSFVFILGHTQRVNIRSINDLINYLRAAVSPFCADADAINDLDFQHLDYSRCSIRSVARRSLEGLLRQNYSSAFYKPIKRVDIDGVKHNGKTLFEWFPEMFCVNDGYSFGFSDLGDFESKLNASSCPDFIKKYMKDFVGRHLESESEVRKILYDKGPDIQKIFELWEKGCARLNLSSVGISLGIINARNRIGINLDINKWLS